MSKKDAKPSRVLDLEGKYSDGRLFATFHYLECKSEETRYAHWHCHGSRWIYLKEELLSQLRAAGHEVVDFGAHRLSEDDDYPDYVVPARTGRCRPGGGTWRGDLRQRRGRVGVRQQGAGHPCGAHPRPLLCQARGRGRSPEHPVYGRQDRRTSRRLGPRPDIPGRHSSARPSDTCGAWAKWLP